LGRIVVRVRDIGYILFVLDDLVTNDAFDFLSRFSCRLDINYIFALGHQDLALLVYLLVGFLLADSSELHLLLLLLGVL